MRLNQSMVEGTERERKLRYQDWCGRSVGGNELRCLWLPTCEGGVLDVNWSKAFVLGQVG